MQSDAQSWHHNPVGLSLLHEWFLGRLLGLFFRLPDPKIRQLKGCLSGVHTLELGNSLGFERGYTTSRTSAA